MRKIHRRISQQARFGGSCRSVCIAAGSMTRWPAEVTPDRRVGTFPPGVHRWCDQAQRVHVFQLAFKHTESILNTYYSYVWYLYRRTLRQSYVCAVVYSGHFCFGGDRTKPSITIASVDRFYLNLVICLQLDIVLLVQDYVKIWHCLSELWQCIEGGYFFRGHCVYDTQTFILTIQLLLVKLSADDHAGTLQALRCTPLTQPMATSIIRGRACASQTDPSLWQVQRRGMHCHQDYAV